MKNLLGIACVWFGCSVAWMMLGATLEVRSGSASSSMWGEVQNLWGPEVVNGAPSAMMQGQPLEVLTPSPTELASQEAERAAAQAAGIYQPPPPVPQTHAVSVDLVGSELRVNLDTEQRRRGLVWFPTYTLDFEGTYTFRSREGSGDVRFSLPLQRAGDGFDGFEVTRDGQPLDVRFDGGVARWEGEMLEGEPAEFHVVFRSRGVSTWGYEMTQGTGEVRDFHLAATVNDPDIDFLPGSASPSTHGVEGDDWRGEWQFSRLVSDDNISIALSRKVDPGPAAARITFFGPVGLLFFFFVVAMVARTPKRQELAGADYVEEERRTERQALHPMHYFFLGCGFFAFHLLFAYLVDHLEIAASFGLSAIVSVFLVVSYARLFVGWRFAVGVMGVAQLLYLVLFSASFFVEGFTGLTVTLGAIMTLFVMMQLTGRTRWVKAPAPPAPARVSSDVTAPVKF